MKHIVKTAGLLALALLVLTAAGSAKAQTVDMALGDYATYADVVNLGDLSIPGGNPTEQGYIGIYSFNVTGGNASALPNGTTFWSTCLSPAGEIGGGSPAYSYDYETFAQANAGLNPSTWAWNGDNSNPQYWGIQNADYLWRAVEGNNRQPTLNADQAAGLVLAMYDALYNSTGYGALGGGSYGVDWSDAIASGNPAAVQAAYNTDVALLSGANVANSLAGGYVLVPDPSSPDYGQEFLFIAPSTLYLPVPEPGVMGVLAGLGGLIVTAGRRLRRVPA